MPKQPDDFYSFPKTVSALQLLAAMKHMSMLPNLVSQISHNYNLDNYALIQCVDRLKTPMLIYVLLIYHLFLQNQSCKNLHGIKAKIEQTNPRSAKVFGNLGK